MNKRIACCLIPFLLFLIVFCTYLLTLMPTIWWSDAAELSVLAYELGIPHPTGYPLYMLFGWAFTKLPIGDIAYRVNLLSAFFGAIAPVILYYIVRELTKAPWAGAIAGLCFAFSFTEWSQSTIAEVYTLNSLLISLCVLSLILWRREKAPLTTFAFLFGLSQAHHRTSVILAIPFSVFILLHDPAVIKQPKRILKLFGAALLPQIFYAYLIIRKDWPSWQPLLEFVIRGGAQSWFHLPSTWAEFSERALKVIWPLSIKDFGLIGFILGLAGIISLVLSPDPLNKSNSRKKLRKGGILLLLSWLTNTAFCLCYYAPDIDVFMIPSHLFIALGIGIASFVIVQLFSLHSEIYSRVRYLLIALCTVFPITLLLTHFEPMDRSEDFHFRDNSRMILKYVEPNAWIFTKWSSGWPLIYVQRIEKLRPDVTIQLAENPEPIDVLTPATAGNPVYFLGLQPIDGQVQRYNFQEIPELRTEKNLYVAGLTLRDPTYVAPAMQHTLQAQLGNNIKLLGYDLDVIQNSRIQITLYWQPGSRILNSYTVFVH